MLKVGDKIEWSSQANGYGKRKRGEIAFVLPPGVSALEFLRSRFGADPTVVKSIYNINAIDGGGGSREHESYIISTRRTERTKPHLYWPIASKLRKI